MSKANKAIAQGQPVVLLPKGMAGIGIVPSIRGSPSLVLLAASHTFLLLLR